MRARVPVIKTDSDTPGPGRFNVGFNQPEEVKCLLERLMVKKGNLDWRIPRDEVVIESSREIERIMQEPPIDRRNEVKKGKEEASHE